MEILRFLADAYSDEINKIQTKLPNVSTDLTLQNVLNWVYGFGGLVAVAIIMYGGYKYISSQGSPDKTKQAAQILAYAVIGLGVIILASLITTFVFNAIEGAKA